MSTSAPEQSRRRWVSLALVLLAVAAAVAVWDVIPQINGHYGVWSVVPPLVAIVLAFWTREVIPALFAARAGGVAALAGRTARMGALFGQPAPVIIKVAPETGDRPMCDQPEFVNRAGQQVAIM